jgi:hypothetical protein
MQTLFVSKSRSDDAAAKSLEAWLGARGFGHTFIDYGSGRGEERAEAMREVMASCQAVRRPAHAAIGSTLARCFRV